jgi:Tfp pilus assembly PilM family ATPase
MAKRYSSVLGVDIGSQNIKVTEVKMQGKNPAVTAWGMAQTPQGAVDHNGIHDAEQIATLPNGWSYGCRHGGGPQRTRQRAGANS